MTLRQAVGQMLVFGLEGDALTQLQQSWIQMLTPGGVILFQRNVAGASQTVALLDDVERAAGYTMFRCVDMEGGVVDRMHHLLGAVPSAARAAAGGVRMARGHGEIIGQVVRVFGFNVTFAPVLDLALPESASVMGSRAVSANPRGVIDYADEFLHGLRKQSILGCGKHFPGLGGGNLDSHFEIPRIARDWKQLWGEDILPYRKLRKYLPFVMVGHAAYPAISGETPASLSPLWVSRVLRRKIGYDGLIVTDDLEMGAVLSGGIDNAAIDAVEAGVDMFLVCHLPELVLAAYEAVLHEAERSPAFRRKVERAADRVVAAKRQMRRHNKHANDSVSSADGEVPFLRERIAAFNAACQRQANRGR
jgi:beta-N-acetylhexosaminidase